MQIDKLRTYIGFAIKSGKVVFGYDKLFENRKSPNIVLICTSLNEKAKQKIHNFCDENSIKYIDLCGIVLNDLVSKNNCKCLGICDMNLSKVIIQEIEMLNGNMK